MSEDIVKRLRIKAGVMEMGEQIAWGSDTALMREAAHVIEALRKNNDAAPELLKALHDLLDYQSLAPDAVVDRARQVYRAATGCEP